MCTGPLTAYRNPKGGRLVFRSPTKIVRSVKNLSVMMEVEIPCGQCLECRIAKARDWAVRIMHDVEMEMYINNRESSFVTLTYNDENLPYVYEKRGDEEVKTDRKTLRKDHLKKFLAKLRESKRRRGETKIRYFASGEYGDINIRPHYHCILIGCEFKDQYIYTTSESGYDIYRSDYLEDLWSMGDISIQPVTFSAAEYCAKDVVKRITESNHERHKKWLEENGVKSIEEYYNGRIKEFSIKSRRPGLGARWIDCYYKDVFPHGKMPKINGVHLPIPRYYVDRVIEKEKVKAEVAYSALKKSQLTAKQFVDYFRPSKTKNEMERRKNINKLLRKDDYNDRLIDRNEIKKKKRKNYDEFKQSNKTFFDI